MGPDLELQAEEHPKEDAEQSDISVTRSAVANYRFFVGVNPTDWFSAKVHEIKSGLVLVGVPHPENGELVVGGVLPPCLSVDGNSLAQAEDFEVGQEVKVRVLSTDATARKMHLSMQEAPRITRSVERYQAF